MTSNTLNAVPATVLETMAERLNGQPEPLKIRSNDDHAALAADVLWKFARKPATVHRGPAAIMSLRLRARTAGVRRLPHVAPSTSQPHA
ncbi:hypothetical protein ACP4BH_004182 [Enterobacter hormaechei]